MFVFFRCIAEAVVENGLKGLAEMVPGGKFAFDVAEGAWRKYKERKQPAEQREEIQRLVGVSFEQAQTQADEAARAALAGRHAAPEDAATLGLYLAAVPEAVRQSFKRADDPTGRTVPAGFHLDNADDVVKFLPARPPRFRAGMDLPGKSGWVLVRLLGIGGFGEVWFAQHARMKSLSGAVKFCFGQSGQDLIHEAGLIDRVMSVGKHPNIVPLVDVHLEGPTPWLLFEYVAGGTLTDWIHGLAGLTTEERREQALAALRQLTGAVEFFHAQTPPVVHRDLKPSNVLLDRDAFRITDFGIGAVTARETLRQESRGQSTRGGRLLTYLRGSHTPIYASSQQRDGHDPDPRDDVHALGVIGYQMLTGHLAQGAGPDFADDLRDAGADEGTIALLGRCVAQKAERRPKDAQELCGLLAGLGATKPVPRRAEAPATNPNPVPRIDAKATSEEGEKFFFGRGVTQDYVRAAELYRKAADQGYATAQHNLGVMYMNGLGVAKDDARAVAWYRKAAEQGHATAQYQLGEMNENGRGVAKDDARAVAWYRKAAEQGHATAQYNLGVMYMNGRGVAKDDAQAVAWYRKAAEQGQANAPYNLGWMYANGEGVAKDDAQAVAWFRKAAEQGHTTAQYSLGVMYMNGRGVAKDDARAVAWYRKAAEQGHADAQYHLGWMYANGEGVAKDDAQAVAWYRKAAEQGHADVQNNLGVMYANGLGVAKDDARAVAWFRKAAEQGQPDAIKALARRGLK